jgi:threonine dehydrogenase-like Zn-dependent dehydrogenase
MKSAILDKDGFRLINVNKPVAKADEVVVDVTYCGVCSGDFHLYQTKNNINQPLALGHEVVGIVSSVGEEVTELITGDLVTAVDGIAGYSEQFVAPVHFLSKLSKGAQANSQLGEPIACCVHAVNRLNILPHHKVAIVGCGFMGLVCQKLIIEQGCQQVTAFDLQDYRKDMAITMGADVAYDPTQYQISDPDLGEYDIVVEAAGVASALDFCGDLVAHHGQLLIVGYHQSGEGMRQVNMQRWNYKAIDVLNGHIRDMSEKFDAMQQGLIMCEQGKLDLSPLLQNYPLNDIETAFQDLQDPSKKLFKAVITN